MIRTVANVIRGEGLASAWRRASERVGEAFQNRFPSDGEIVNVGSLSARTGGIAVQLAARLRAERHLRRVAVSRDIPTAAKVIHLEGTFGVPVDAEVVVSLHDTTLTDRRLLDAARGVIVASPFLRDFYGVGVVVEPAIPAAPVILSAAKDLRMTEVAFAGAVKRHKGAYLLPELARMMASRRLTLHIFGGGDVDLLRALRRERNVIVHGYYRAAVLPALLARHGIGLVVVPSIVAEGYCMTLSEAWLAGAAVAAFDLGAQAERIRRLGGGWLAPLASGAAGLMEIIDQWQPIEVPPVDALPIDAARAHVALYRAWGLLA
jgi:hypothetical protein